MQQPSNETNLGVNATDARRNGRDQNAFSIVFNAGQMALFFVLLDAVAICLMEPATKGLCRALEWELLIYKVAPEPQDYQE
jgi:hypothetical protein